MGARYIFGNKKFSNVTHMLSNVTSGIISNPYKLENTLGMIRTFAPLASAQAVGKINLFLPMVEKFSSILGMYSFLNKAQNYAPIQSLSNKPPMEKITSLIANGNVPIGKILAQPIISKNMDKIVSAVAQNVMSSSLKNGGLEQMLASVLNNMPNNTTNNSNNTTNNNSSNNSSESNIDINSMIQMFGSILNNSNTTSNGNSESNNENSDILNKNNK